MPGYLPNIVEMLMGQASTPEVVPVVPSSGYPPCALLYLWQSGVGETPPRDLPYDLEVAAYQALIADTVLMSTSAGLKGGLWQREAQYKRPNGGYPFGSVEIRNPHRIDTTNHGDFEEEGLIRIEVVSRDNVEAKRLADRAMYVLATTQLEFETGWGLHVRPENPDYSKKPQWGPDGFLVWNEIRAMHYLWNGRLPYPGQPTNL